MVDTVIVACFVVNQFLLLLSRPCIVTMCNCIDLVHVDVYPDSGSIPDPPSQSSKNFLDDVVTFQYSFA